MFTYKLEQDSVTRVSIDCPEGLDQHIDYDVTITSSFEFNEADSSFGRCKLIFCLASKENNSSPKPIIEIECHGIYKIISLENDIENIQDIISKDYYPYLRAHVSTIMAASTLPALTLPPYRSSAEEV